MIRSWSPCDLPEWHRKSAPGDMPLNLDTVYCAARLFGELWSAEREQWEGTLGTGFFVKVKSETLPDVSHQYLVTADHVVAGCRNLVVQIGHPAFKGEVSPPIPVNNFTQPLRDLDVAVAPFAPPTGVPCPMAVRLDDHFIPDNRMLFPGSIIYYVGLFQPLNRTMVRSGTIGALDQEGIQQYVQREAGEKNYTYISHLVDCRSYEGFSGSPCFVDVPFAKLSPTSEHPPDMPASEGPIGDIKHVTLLCGMFTAHVDDSRPDGTVARYGVGIMLPSEEIREALMTKVLREERAKKDAATAAERAANQPKVKPARATSNEEYERFEDLTRRLGNVPKKDVDAKRDES